MTPKLQESHHVLNDVLLDNIKLHAYGSYAIQGTSPGDPTLKMLHEAWSQAMIDAGSVLEQCFVRIRELMEEQQGHDPTRTTTLN